MEGLKKETRMAEKGQKIKCVVWDLDNTVWTGVLLEDKDVKLRHGVIDIITELDNRGILQSIASKNEYDLAMSKLKEFGIDQYFIYPQINWNAKSISVKNIIQSINIGEDTIAFIDDQIFEREEVKSQLPKVLCMDENILDAVLDLPEMHPKFVTEESKMRRLLYIGDIERNAAEEDFKGAQEEFLSTLEMKLTVSRVEDDDLKRAEELTVRTHQLNSTGYTYSYEELDALSKSDKHKLLIAELSDKYGTYGKIGLCLIEEEGTNWNTKLLLMSCRVMSRGVGTVILNLIMKKAKQENKSLRAEFVSTDRNRIMYITYKFAGFTESTTKDGLIILENNLEHIQDYPSYMKVDTDNF
jgi:FkbH-like protein